MRVIISSTQAHYTAVLLKKTWCRSHRKINKCSKIKISFFSINCFSTSFSAALMPFDLSLLCKFKIQQILIFIYQSNSAGVETCGTGNHSTPSDKMKSHTKSHSTFWGCGDIKRGNVESDLSKTHQTILWCYNPENNNKHTAKVVEQSWFAWINAQKLARFRNRLWFWLKWILDWG